jgi:hypothetical protein
MEWKQLENEVMADYSMREKHKTEAGQKNLT